MVAQVAPGSPALTVRHCDRHSEANVKSLEARIDWTLVEYGRLRAALDALLEAAERAMQYMPFLACGTEEEIVDRDKLRVAIERARNERQP
jgi:hypothetical protein